MKVHWWEDSVSKHTCHRNERGLSFAESYIGELVKRGDDWHFKLSGSCTLSEPYDNMLKARKELERAVGGSGIEIWE